MRVSIDRRKCRKCGLCAAVCPEIFEVGRDHIARVKHLEVPPIGDLQEFCTYACKDCPGGAIEVTPAPSCAKAMDMLEELTAETKHLCILP